jgi:hypothetical protein
MRRDFAKPGRKHAAEMSAVALTTVTIGKQHDGRTER